MNGYIKLFRQLIEWEWYTDTNVKSLFLHCLLVANFKDKKWQGNTIKRGQFITSYNHLSLDTGMSIRCIRTALDKLEQSGEIIRASTSTFTVITVCKFDSYQCKEEQTDTPPTSKRQASDKRQTNKRQTTDKQTTTTEEGKEREESKESKEVNKKDILENVTFPPQFNEELIACFKLFLKMRTEIKKAFKSSTAIQTRINSLAKDVERYGVEAVIDATNRTIENQWQGIKVNWNEDKKTQPIAKEINNFSYTLPNFSSPAQRKEYFKARYQTYKPHLSQKLTNGIYRDQFLYGDVEKMVFDLEKEKPELLNIKFVADTWQHTT